MILAGYNEKRCELQLKQTSVRLTFDWCVFMERLHVLSDWLLRKAIGWTPRDAWLINEELAEQPPDVLVSQRA